MASRSVAVCFSAAAASRGRSRSRSRRRFLAVNCDARTSDLLYSSLASKILGPPTTFDAAKLKVEFVHQSKSKSKRSDFPRTYILSHCDFTANLTLAVSDTINADRLIRTASPWHWQRDDVFAEWKHQHQPGDASASAMALHVHCYVSGANLLQDLVAGVRNYVFSKELPLVLKAVVHGDAALFAEQPELLEAKVWVHFHSSSNKYNRIECWGALKDAAKRNALDGRLEQLQSAITKRRRKPADTIFGALLALLL